MTRRAAWEPEPKALTRALAPLRRGAAGERRARVRTMLLRLMGFAEGSVPRFYSEQSPLDGHAHGRIPSHFGRDELAPQDQAELGLVTMDALRELGYDAAADMLARGRFAPYSARDALENFEGGPPSFLMDTYAVFKRPIRRIEGYVIAHAVDSSRPWMIFVVGRAIDNRRGDWVGWDDDAGFTFRSCHKTLKDATEELERNLQP